MKETTKVALQAFVDAVAKQNGVSDATEKFNVNPAAEQRLVAKIRESNWLLGKVNVITVTHQSGQALGLSVGGMLAGRTNTKAGNKRKTKSVHNLDAMNYECKQTNFDTHIRYDQLDAFAHLKNFQKIVSSKTREQIDLNKITVGFYGREALPDTDADKWPNGEDVNKGWLQALRDNKPSAFLKGKEDGKLRLGHADGDFLNLDLLVHNTKSLLGDAAIHDPNLVAIIGTDLLSYDKAKFYEAHGNTPSEKARVQETRVIGTYGGLPAVSAPGFPPRGVMVTTYDNLSIYIQEGSTRRSVGKKNDELDQIDNFESMNMAYVIEDLDKAAAIEFDHVDLWMGTDWESVLLAEEPAAE